MLLKYSQMILALIFRYNWKSRTKKFPRRWPPNNKIQHKNGNFAFHICCIALWRYHNQRAFFKNSFPVKTYIQSLFWQRIRLSSWASYGIVSWSPHWSSPIESIQIFTDNQDHHGIVYNQEKNIYWENYIFKNIGF